MQLDQEQIIQAIKVGLRNTGSEDIAKALDEDEISFPYTYGSDNLSISVYPKHVKTKDFIKALEGFIDIPLEVKYFGKRFGLFANKNGIAEISFDVSSLSDSLKRSEDAAVKEFIAQEQAKFDAEEEAKAQREADKRAADELAAKAHAKKQDYLDRQKGTAIKGDELDTEAVCIVHATAYMPKISPDGAAEIQTTSTAENNMVFRNTVHTSLSHKVNSHMLGNWDESKIVIIGNFKDVMDANGNPAIFNPVDTFWTRDVEESLIIPNATIVQPGVPEEGLYEISEDGKNVFYKETDFSAKDIDNVFAELVDSGGYDLEKFINEKL